MNDFELTDIVSLIEAALVTLKETHWSTNNHWIHKQSDEIKDYLSKTQDELAEIVLGSDDFNKKSIELKPEEFLEEFRAQQSLDGLLSLILHAVKDYYIEIEALEANNDSLYGQCQPRLTEGIKSTLDELIGKLQKSRYLSRMQ